MCIRDSPPARALGVDRPHRTPHHAGGRGVPVRGVQGAPHGPAAIVVAHDPSGPTGTQVRPGLLLLQVLVVSPRALAPLSKTGVASAQWRGYSETTGEFYGELASRPRTWVSRRCAMPLVAKDSGALIGDLRVVPLDDQVTALRTANRE